MERHVEQLRAAAQIFLQGNRPNYRQRLQLERAVFTLTAKYIEREFSWQLRSTTRSAFAEFQTLPAVTRLTAEDPRLEIVRQSFLAMWLIARISTVDPYVTSDYPGVVVLRKSKDVNALVEALANLAENQAFAS
jgi:hypothetical protein